MYFLAAAYALVAIRETLARLQRKSDSDTTEDDESTHSDNGSEVGSITAIATAVKTAAIPVKPLRVLIPYRDEKGVLRWELLALAISLFATTCGTVFVPTAVLFFLSDKFGFDTEKASPSCARKERKQLTPTRKTERQMKQGGETRPLLDQRASVASEIRRRNNAEEANHFDVILAFASVCLDGLSFAFVFKAPSYQYVLASFILVALGSGDVPSYKSVFIATVPDDRATEALAALDMVLNIAKLTSPPLLGALYTVFVRRGQPEVVFLAASVNE
ncbi:hypothetical protein QFC24_004579 [Naganishia onofrii]|uniref:Uncharacterized protein n=1 Tax=Naganishia onofrii TaxID=1851511 RepID=A0ACC2XF26_9TREE|nr:hypothetical protein QFC24_004579 [Naganishia onofrii]